MATHKKPEMVIVRTLDTPHGQSPDAGSPCAVITYPFLASLSSRRNLSPIPQSELRQ